MGLGGRRVGDCRWIGEGDELGVEMGFGREISWGKADWLRLHCTYRAVGQLSESDYRTPLGLS